MSELNSWAELAGEWVSEIVGEFVSECMSE